MGAGGGEEREREKRKLFADQLQLSVHVGPKRNIIPCSLFETGPRANAVVMYAEMHSSTPFRAPDILGILGSFFHSAKTNLGIALQTGRCRYFLKLFRLSILQSQ